MLDTKRTFDRLIAKYAPTPEHARRILSNHIYVKFSGQLAGSQEYMSMEKLYELSASGRYDLIILDTPPTKHALDFLTAPKRMTDVLDRSILDILMRPLDAAGRFSLGLMMRTAKRVLKTVDQAVGMQFLSDLSEFFRAFEGLYDGFRERAAKVNDLLRSRTCRSSPSS
ncbi:hypothetical protein HY251_11975 [bacterium]|nr:hypothetical protein [bacterium]